MRPGYGHGSRREPGLVHRAGCAGDGIECGRRCEPWGYGGGACASSHAPAVPTTDGPRPSVAPGGPASGPAGTAHGSAGTARASKDGARAFRPADHTARGHARPAGTRDPRRGHFGGDGVGALRRRPVPGSPRRDVRPVGAVADRAFGIRPGRYPADDRRSGAEPGPSAIPVSPDAAVNPSRLPRRRRNPAHGGPRRWSHRCAG